MGVVYELKDGPREECPVRDVEIGRLVAASVCINLPEHGPEEKDRAISDPGRVGHKEGCGEGQHALPVSCNRPIAVPLVKFLLILTHGRGRNDLDG